MLLRFLQEREVRPLGATRPLAVDLRVIAATNRDLAGAMRAGEFRADLHDRLSEIVLRVPPLRERREDLPLLVAHFVGVHARRHGRPAPRVSQSVLRALAAHPWPGNVRELEQAISRAVIFSEGGWIRAEDLGLDGEGDPVAGPPREAGLAIGLTARQSEVLRLAALRGSLSRRDLVRGFGISGESARRDLVALARLALLRQAGGHRGSRYFTV